MTSYLGKDTKPELCQSKATQKNKVIKTYNMAHHITCSIKISIEHQSNKLFQ